MMCIRISLKWPMICSKNTITGWMNYNRTNYCCIFSDILDFCPILPKINYNPRFNSDNCFYPTNQHAPTSFFFFCCLGNCLLPSVSHLQSLGYYNVTVPKKKNSIFGKNWLLHVSNIFAFSLNRLAGSKLSSGTRTGMEPCQYGLSSNIQWF